MKFKWEGDKASRKVFAKLAANLDEAGEELETLVKADIGIAGPPRSSPGNPPHIDTGALIESYDHVTDRSALVTTVGSTVDHAVYLETGTDRMAPRPHLVNNLISASDGLSRIVAKP